MITSLRTKRVLSLSLLILGGVLFFFAAEDVWLGVVFIALGIAVEIAGLVIGHRK